MSVGIYNAASAMVVRLSELDTIAHNLANANSPGYRAQRLSFSNFGETLLWLTEQLATTRQPARLPLGVTVGGQRLDLRQGEIRPTGNPLDVAIDGDGWFVVRTTQGTRYTRKGNFALARDGTLVTPEGYPVLGTDNQSIRIRTNSVDSIRIAETGEIFAGTQRLGQLRTVRVQNLQPAGEGYYVGVNPQPTNVRIVQGALEGSNVGVITEMVRLLSALRSYEMAARTFPSFETSKQALLEATKA